MEDAHAAILDLQPESAGKDPKAAAPDKRLAFFGVYDGHGGDKVALFGGEHIHKIVAKQEAFAKGDIEQALKDGFLATDRAILNGRCAGCLLQRNPLMNTYRSKVFRRGLWMYGFRGYPLERQNLGGTLHPRESHNSRQVPDICRPMREIPDQCLG